MENQKVNIPDSSGNNLKLVCPLCRASIISDGKSFVCRGCLTRYPVRDGVPDFRENDEYWCNVPREKMRLLNQKAKETNDWLAAASSLVPEYSRHFTGFERADAQYIWPVDSKSIVLDAGSMWGGLTIPVAQHAKEVFAVDKTIETLSFLNIRSRQMGLDNIHPIAATLERLPFPDNYFDLVILNGVLEWVAFRQDIILEKHWNGKNRLSKIYDKNPTEMQIEVLKELRRVTKPQGHLFLAIENRLGYQYLTGYPDDHVNIPFVTFLPRFLADLITKLKRGYSYRTYVYSLFGLKNILKKAGYKGCVFYGAFPHYLSASRIIPFKLIKYFRGLVRVTAGKRASVFIRSAPAGLLKLFSPSIAIIAKKGDSDIGDARIVRLIKKTGILNSEEVDLQPILMSGRKSTYNPLHCLIVEGKKRKPLFFCKISRSRQYTDALTHESENLIVAERLLRGSQISSRIPRLLYSGVIDGITLLVTDCFTCGPFNLGRITSGRLVNLEKAVKLSIDFLILFQNKTFTRELRMPDILKKIEHQINTLEPVINAELSQKLSGFTKHMAGLPGAAVNLCAVHGDFDFYSNILNKDNKVHLVDFEHFQKEGLPFYDLITLIFHPFLMEYKRVNPESSFTEFLTRVNGVEFIKRCISYYVSLARVDKKISPYILTFALLEQNAKEYPFYREESSYPLRDVGLFLELLNLDLENK